MLYSHPFVSMVPHLQTQPTSDAEYFGEKKTTSESFKKQNLNLPNVGNYLHSIQTAFIIIYIVLGIISNKDDLKCKGGYM